MIQTCLIQPTKTSSDICFDRNDKSTQKCQVQTKHEFLEMIFIQKLLILILMMEIDSNQCICHVGISL